MRGNLQQALDNTDMLYAQVKEIAYAPIQEYFSEIDKLINGITDNINNLTNDEIRNIMNRLQKYAWGISEVKDLAISQLHNAESLRDEAYAQEFNKAEGSNEVRKNLATLNISDEIVCEAAKDLTASLFKTKLDGLYRFIDTLKTILLTRLQEAKLAMSGIGE